MIQYRSHISRGNVAYRVHIVAVNKAFNQQFWWVEMPEVIIFIQARIQRIRPRRVIIYSTTKAYITQVAKQLEYKAYYSKQVNKNRILALFRAILGAVIMATSALGMGINIPDIHSIIYLGQPQTILDYTQESRYAGRDRQLSKAVIIQGEGRQVSQEIWPLQMQDYRAAKY